MDEDFRLLRASALLPCASAFLPARVPRGQRDSSTGTETVDLVANLNKYGHACEVGGGSSRVGVVGGAAGLPRHRLEMRE